MDSDSECVEALEKSLNYSFVNKSLVRDALTYKNPGTFGRLRVLGHNVVRLAFTTYLHLAYPNLQPSDLDKLRVANLGHEKLARISLNLGLHQLVQNNSHINHFLETLPKDDPAPFGAFTKPPKLVSEIFESVAGAVYTDVNCNVHRLWEVLRGFFEPVYTLSDLEQTPQVLATLFRVGDKAGKPITYKLCSVGQLVTAHVYLGDTCIAPGPPKEDRGHAIVAAAKHALLKLSKSTPIETVMGDKTLEIQMTDAAGDLALTNSVEEGEDSGKRFVFSAKSKTPAQKVRKGVNKRKKLRQAKEWEKMADNSSASHRRRALKFSLKDDLQKMPPEMAMDEKSLDIETEEAKDKLIEKSLTPTNSVEQGGDAGKGFVCAATMETPTEEIVMGKDSIDNKSEDAKEKLTEIYNERKFSNPTISVGQGGDAGKGFVCSATMETPTEETATIEDCLGNKTEDAIVKLIEKSPNPTNSVEEGGDSGKGLVGSADKIETPTEESSLKTGKKKRKRIEQKIPDIETKDAKEKLIEKSPNPTNSVEQGGGAGKGFVCSATNTMETPTEERVVITID